MASKISQILGSIKTLNAGITNLNNAIKGRQGIGGIPLNNINNPFSLAKLTSVSFWSDVLRNQDLVRARALSINTSPQKLAEMAGTGVQRAGFTNAVLNQFEMLNTGLDSSLESTKELGLQMRVTGQNENKLYQVMRQGQVIGGLTNRSIENLSGKITTLSQTYTISQESLIDGIQQVVSNMDIATLGQTENFSNLSLDIQKYGAGASQLANEIEVRAAAGQTFVTDQIVGAFGGIGTTLESFKQYTSLYSNRFGDFIKQFPPQMRAIGLQMAKGIFGDVGQLSFNLNKVFANGEKGATGAEDKFSTLRTAMATLFTPIDALASNVIPFLSKNIMALTLVMAATQTASLLGKGLGVIGGFGGIGAMLPILAPFLPEILAIGVGLAGIGLTLKYIFDENEEQSKAAREQLDIEKRRDQIEREKSMEGVSTSKYMELQSQAINDSIDRIMFNGDLARRLASETDKKKIELQEKLLIAISKIDPRFMGPMKTNMSGAK